VLLQQHCQFSAKPVFNDKTASSESARKARTTYPAGVLLNFLGFASGGPDKKSL
jgi:hypothetical protein